MPSVFNFILIVHLLNREIYQLLK